jgi:hypothetical protein
MRRWLVFAEGSAAGPSWTTPGRGREVDQACESRGQSRAAVVAPATFLARLDETAFAEHREMSRDGRLVAPHEGLQVADADFFAADPGQELQARRI